MMEFQPPANAQLSAVTEDEFDYIKALWLTEQDIVLSAASGNISEAERVEQLREIRAEIYGIMYQEGKQ